MATSKSASGLGFWSVLALMFIGFKLTGYIEWSWVWVLAPLWAPFALILAVILLGLTLSTLIEDR